MTWMDTGGVDPEDGLVYDARWGCDECGIYYSWPVTPGRAPKDDPRQTEMLAIIAEHTPESCLATQAKHEEEFADSQHAFWAGQERASSVVGQADADYAFLESLGAHHPAEVSLTVAEAEERERRGIPLPIGGDPETDLARDLTLQRRHRELGMLAKANLQREALAGRPRHLLFLGFLSPVKARVAGPLAKAVE